MQGCKGSAMSPDDYRLKRNLKSRHITMISIGGAIGTGLFLLSGEAVSLGGAGSAVCSYIFMGIVVYLLMSFLGEMATTLPLSGSFETYASAYVDPALGFALGWNYWLMSIATVTAEIVAGSIIVSFWLPDANAVCWSLLFLSLIFILNAFSARVYGESEFWFAGIKVFTIIIFIITGVLMIFGIIGGEAPGFSNICMVDNESGKAGPFIGGMSSFLTVLFIAGWSFAGTELIGITAGESENPAVNIPKATRAVFWRILAFYVCTIIVISFLIPFNDPNLLKTNTTDIAYSPFTMVFYRAGMAFAASFMNAIILTSVLSAGNSLMYASTRMLYAMACEGKAPKILAAVNRFSVPFWALLFNTLVACTAFFSSTIGSGHIYTLLVNISGVTTFIAWLGIALCHYRFRKAYVLQGYSLERLPYRSRFYPYGQIAAMVVTVGLIFFANMWIFEEENFTWFTFLSNYGIIPLFIGMYALYKKKYKTRWVAYKDIDFSRIHMKGKPL